MRIRLALGLSILCLSPGAADHAPTSSRPSTAASSVDLSAQFRKEVPQQGRTGTCASFSAVALLEAACRRASHRELDLSEGFVIYRHLRNRLKEGSYVARSQLKVGKQLLGNTDGGMPAEILRHVLKVGVVLEPEFTVDGDLFPLVNQAKVSTAKAHPIDPKEEQAADEDLEAALRDSDILRNSLCKGLDDVQCRFATESGDAGIKPVKLDPKVQECFDKLGDVQAIESGTVSQALALLEKGQPFICSFSGYRGNHASIILGSRRNRDNPDQIEWLVRDSALWGKELNDPKPLWRSWKASADGRLCGDMTLLPTRSETPDLAKMFASWKKPNQSN